MPSPPEEELMLLFKFGTSRKIRDFINNNPSMDLHYPNKLLSTPLTSAIDRSDPVLLTLLIDKIPGNLDATLTQPCGKTALMHAAYYAKNPEILNVLIKKGADANKRDINGWTCLFYAVIGKRLENVTTLLLDSKVSIESRDNEGRTPLMISVYLSNNNIFDHLINCGADLQAVDNNNLGVLHLAILRRKRDCVIELSKRNGNLNLLTPLSKVSAQQLIDELMSDVFPVRRNYYEDEYDGDNVRVERVLLQTSSVITSIKNNV